MDYAGADIQGAVGYMFLKALRNAFKRRGIAREPACVVTQTLVDRNDPAFSYPTKPIGSHMEEARAKQLAKKYHWTVREDAGRVAPRGALAQAAGHPGDRGHQEPGRPGLRGRRLRGRRHPRDRGRRRRAARVEAVIDKDLASSLLARSMEADILVLPTGVEKVALDFNKPTQRWLDRITLAEACKHQADGQFDPGHGPKIAALVDFVGGGGRMGLITNLPNSLARCAAKSARLLAK